MDTVQTTDAAPSKRSGLLAVCQAIGLHPLVGFAVAAIDTMLFAEEAATIGTGWAISIPVAIVLALGATLVQRHSFKDGWGAAIGKGLLLGVLTAIPTSIPGVAVGLVGAVPGVAKYLLSAKAPTAPQLR